MQKITKTCYHHRNFNSASTSKVYNHPDLTHVVEFIKDTLFFATLAPGRKTARCTEHIILFNTDNELVYNPINSDFGPLNLACLYRFCSIVGQKLKHLNNKHRQIVYYTCENENKRANAAFLIASFAILYLGKTPIEVNEALDLKDAHPLKLFLDAGHNVLNLELSLLDCINGIKKAQKYGLFNFKDFNLTEYEKYMQLRNGDLNWIVPQKFIAFMGPSTEKGTQYHQPEKYFNYFNRNGVEGIIRLNRKCYEAARFRKVGIKHYELYMPDGTAPTQQNLQQFLKISETAKGAIAVHCKAGLGRTGTLIAAYIIKHYKMKAREAIAWVRICRPGSIIAPQQRWLEEMEGSLWRAGQFYRLVCHHRSNSITRHMYGIYSIINKLEKTIDSIIPGIYHSLKYSEDYSEILQINQRLKQLRREIYKAETYKEEENEEATRFNKKKYTNSIRKKQGISQIESTF